MSGKYEQQWQEALAGATIQPSEGLWRNIANNLDKERGRNNWLTILLIAATVTVAMAFPLTIGNSSYESRPDIRKYIGQDDKGLIESGTKGIAENEYSSGLLAREPAPVLPTNNSHEINSNSATRNHVVEIVNKGEPTPVDVFNLSAVPIRGVGLSEFSLVQTMPVANIDDYYFIPFYVSSKVTSKRSMLASLNMGTGSLAAGSGFNGFGAMKADFSEASLSNDAVADQRTETAGTTTYFGVGVELPLGKRWSFLSGLGYLAQNSTGTSNVVLDNGNGYNPLGVYDPILPGTVYLSEPYDYSVTNTYINVPLTFKYPFINRKLKFRGGIGLSTDFMIGHAVSAVSYGKTQYNPAIMGYNTFALAGLINLDISYSLNNQYSVAFETGLRRGFTSIDDNKNYYPSSFTVGIIFFYKIQ
jgi:Outer membrane protein beta-barrel domain